jgi:L-asparaginase
MVAPRPQVALIVTGGTIDSIGRDRLDLASYVETAERLAPGQMAGALPELAAIAAVSEVPFRRVPSHALTTADWLDLARTVQALFAERRVDAVVITHGTNTIEETAYFLGLTLKTDRPVVLVGAMRPASALSPDGPLNLLNAVRVAADPASVGRGVLVVMNDTILGARDVTKTTTYRVQALAARDAGPLGYADADGRVVYQHRPQRRHTTDTEFDVATADALPRVDIVVSYVGADGALIDAAVAAGAKGIVSAGTGAGRPTPLEDAALDRACGRGVVVCQSSRVGAGRVTRSSALAKRGFVAADDLQPWKARVLLSLALSRTTEADRIQRMFDEH